LWFSLLIPFIGW
jgi:hypothetical protein